MTRRCRQLKPHRLKRTETQIMTTTRKVLLAATGLTSWLLLAGMASG